jgi:DNA-binding response OmpR family regulator
VNNTNILLVDDDPDQIELLTMLFEAKAHKVYVAKSIREGQKILRRKAIDLMITDYSMPDGTGNLLLQQKNRAPINILISGHPFDKTEWKKQFGFDAYFLKPCEHMVLLDMITILLQKNRQPIRRVT